MKIYFPLLSSIFLVAAVFSQQAESLGEQAARLRAAKGGSAQAAAAATSAVAPSSPASSVMPAASDPEVGDCCASEINTYSHQIAQLLMQGKYAELDAMAHDLRVNKTRFQGGAWKLHAFYEGVSEPYFGDYASDKEWAEHLQRLDAWLKAQPKSVTAHIAFANGYMSFGWHARGGGYSDSVTDRGSKLFAGMAEISKNKLLEAEKLEEKCPEWFNAMLRVAQAQGWELQEARALAAAAMKLEPAYYYSYRAFAMIAMPKWYGEEGDSERFAEEIANELGGKLGDAVYAEIAPTLYCLCPGEPVGKMDFQRIVRGYAADESLYGISFEKINKLAYIAVAAGEQAEAKKAFDRLGEHWDRETWRKKDKYDQARRWANGEGALSSVR